MNAVPQPLLQVDKLVKRFGALAATDDASFEVREGEVHALIGPNGAGKTTLIHQISGALAPDSGRIVFAGHELTHAGMAAHVHAGLVRSYQITSIFKSFSVRDNLALAVQARRPGLPSWLRVAVRDQAALAEAEGLLARIGLSAQADRAAGSLGHGEQRQLEVGLALAARPRLLLLDEPMAGMGPDESERMVELLQSLRKEVTLLLVEHDMDAVFRLADRISTLVFGRVIATGTPQEIREHPEVRKAYLGDEMEGAL
ncbi:ABC transporter ATP-binding protein [Roseateles sp.]|jgi:branched-chain amino acid transport system ATP-binding protein|uniref:ABC transporter ATP-binding protein n=1 Tax=Roseateles sp. TaxID=1971397 RepID=UPI0037CC3DE9